MSGYSSLHCGDILAAQKILIYSQHIHPLPQHCQRMGCVTPQFQTPPTGPDSPLGPDVSSDLHLGLQNTPTFHDSGTLVSCPTDPTCLLTCLPATPEDSAWSGSHMKMCTWCTRPSHQSSNAQRSITILWWVSKVTIWLSRIYGDMHVEHGKYGKYRLWTMGITEDYLMWFSFMYGFSLIITWSYLVLLILTYSYLSLLIPCLVWTSTCTLPFPLVLVRLPTSSDFILCRLVHAHSYLSLALDIGWICIWSPPTRLDFWFSGH